MLDTDPDAKPGGEVALYGQAFLAVCLWPGCEQTVSGGRGGPRRWCPQHAQRSGSERARARSWTSSDD
jgi:hypothetical protein